MLHISTNQFYDILSVIAASCGPEINDLQSRHDPLTAEERGHLVQLRDLRTSAGVLQSHLKPGGLLAGEGWACDFPHPEDKRDRVELVRNLIADLKGELAALAGEGLLLVDGHGVVHQDLTPNGGVILEINWATAEACERWWYPNVLAAKARLAAMVEDDEDAVLQDNGWRANFTRPGCDSSWAIITRNEWYPHGYPVPKDE